MNDLDWDTWRAQVEKLLGHSLDDGGVGYSVDDALRNWKAEISPGDYVFNDVKGMPGYAPGGKK